MSTIIWYHEGKPIKTNITSSKKNEQASHLIVYIDSLSKFGAYKCQANNTHGLDEKVIDIIEERKCIFIKMKVMICKRKEKFKIKKKEIIKYLVYQEGQNRSSQIF